MQGRAFDIAVLALGIAAVSTAAVLIREADAPVLVIAAYRLAFASLPLLAFAGFRRRRLLPLGRDRATLTLLSGLLLALHFAFWVASVKQTSVVTATVLVTTTPLFVSLASGPLLQEPPGRSIWLGLGLASAGSLLMVSDDLGAGGDTLRGDAFALLGALFAAAHFIAGRHLLAEGLNWLNYVTVTFTTAAVCLTVLATAGGSALAGYSAETYGIFALLALVPQLMGHTAVNRSLAHLPAVAVSLAVMGEPVGATILAALLLNEQPSLLQLVGGLVVLAGVYAGLRPSLDAKRPPLAQEPAHEGDIV
jgi:drug/metabolite transporter (DMT)-like permease